MKLNKVQRRKRIRNRIRKKVVGTAERPRLAVFKSLKQIYVQAIDDLNGHTLASASSLEKAFKDSGKTGGNMEGATVIGEFIGKRLTEKGITKAVFDRGGFHHHGRIKALADAARKAGLTI
ncbi:MAG: 50S ribosomal protein L18 [Acidobacteria bacterium]|nr:MAG: 50S ribosomal protein L18 [Acidobacteriota bacterium]PIE89995.1 MAG: 50S ribosomal protein L18 [Acidobacteriota bacterium]